eukprot:TRINITY_DN9200_c0_g1_i1.p1 TRINITY_DN9200_c0_g1~~TRINITY_DN9200_c0_g1_i1.p1  ORF type:complete len:227 (+),score=69.85 TRINITY_DN9200_c0_g1_i1:119-799(+)
MCRAVLLSVALLCALCCNGDGGGSGDGDGTCSLYHDERVACYMRTERQVAREMLRLARARSADVVADLGCGDGRVLLMALTEFQARRAIGVDRDAARIRESARTVGAYCGRSPRRQPSFCAPGIAATASCDGAVAAEAAEPTAPLRLLCGDALNATFLRHALEGATVLFVWLNEPLHLALGPLLRQALAETGSGLEGVRVVSRMWPLAGWRVQASLNASVFLQTPT